jgi:hypothetical protein
MWDVKTIRSRTRLSLAILAAAATLCISSPARGDDRDLLRESAGRPYVFILLDTSGSMHWAPPCSQALFDGIPTGCDPNVATDPPCQRCDYLCPTGDCFTPLNGDDSASKLFQAKDALYQVINGTEDIDFGFATFNQDGLRMSHKHWLYKATTVGPVIPGFGAFPAIGVEDVFGYQWNCNNGGGDANVGCTSGNAADLNDAWDTARVHRLPKGGDDFSQVQTFYIRGRDTSNNLQTYRVTYTRVSGNLGDNTIVVQVDPDRCTNSGCTTVSQDPTLLNVIFSKVSDFDSWDYSVGRGPAQLSYFNQGEASDSPAGNTCYGWDPNTDSNSDQFNNYSIRWPTTQAPNPAFRPSLDQGDVLPLSWNTDNKTAVLQRLAPNLALGETTPDFRVARYFQNTPTNSRLVLRDESARPILAFGSTPLGASISDFRAWYTGCSSGTCPSTSGWRGLAAANDPNWGCRRKYLLIVTDGDETCNGEDAACNGTLALAGQEGIQTYVVAYGVQAASGNVLSCMATNGGTGAPIYPQNKQQLIAALNQIFGDISEQTRTFASAAVPSVQAQVADKIYLTSFTPLNNAAVWPGHVDAYLKPLPLTDAGTPNRDLACSGSVESSCHAWDAGDLLVDQAPTSAEVNADTYKLGSDPTYRRVYYPMAQAGNAIPLSKRLFEPPTTQGVWLDLFTGLGVPYNVTNTAPAQTETTSIIRFTLRQKNDTIDNPDGTTQNITYVLGDIFHSNPVVVSNPNRFRYFTADLYGNGRDCTATSNPNLGYRCFFNKHLYRRKMLLVGSDDGQLHAFDAGIFTGTVSDGAVTGEFDDGSGHELFSIIPRVLMPKVRQLAETTEQDWALDGTVVVDDVFIDPEHSGTPDSTQRQWRTVAVTGLREGGRGYVALDITQPDQYQAGPLTQGFFLPDPGPGYVPSCLANYSSTNCGPVPFPSVLWEFSDAEIPDEDGNGYPDLGETWSIANTGRIKVIEDGETVDKFVAVVGGGMDPDKVDRAGDWLYIIDVETGKPIYKRQLVGSAPSEPAAVDSDQNGYLDTIYIGTTAGYMYKADISTPEPIEEVTIPDPGGTTVHRVTASAWEPFPIFTTGGRPIYFPPAVIYVAKLGRYALGFGTGDREDLWSVTGQSGRFYLILDEGFTAMTSGLPLDETSYQAISAVGGEDTGASYLLDPVSGRRPGWHIDLGTDERVITKAFSLSGVTVFTSYIPENQVSGGTSDAVCSRTGQSRIFVVYTDSANAVLTLEDQKTRFWLVSEFVTDPYTEQSATKNPPSSGGGTGSSGPNSDQMNDDLRRVMETLRSLFPDNCKFANFTLNMKTVRSDTGVVFIAPVPICIVEKNWKEF